jgi:hypothetical protein
MSQKLNCVTAPLAKAHACFVNGVVARTMTVADAPGKAQLSNDLRWRSGQDASFDQGINACTTLIGSGRLIVIPYNNRGFANWSRATTSAPSPTLPVRSALIEKHGGLLQPSQRVERENPVGRASKQGLGATTLST